MKSKYNEPLLQYLNKRSTSAYSTRQKALCDIKLLKGKMTEQSFEYWAPRLINKYQNKFNVYPFFTQVCLVPLSLFLPIPIYLLNIKLFIYDCFLDAQNYGVCHSIISITYIFLFNMNGCVLVFIILYCIVTTIIYYFIKLNYIPILLLYVSG